MRSYGQYCSVAKALDVVGDRWTLLVVRELMLQGPCRYTDLHAGLPGIATNLLTERLRDLESAGLVRRDTAPPPVATTLYRLTESGEELAPVLRALGHWGARLMSSPTGDEAFRGHWLAFPVSEFLSDAEPTGPPVEIEIHAGEETAVIALDGGAVSTRLGHAADPALVLDGDAPVIMGFLVGRLSLRDARAMGLRTSGAVSILKRLRSSLADVASPV